MCFFVCVCVCVCACVCVCVCVPRTCGMLSRGQKDAQPLPHTHIYTRMHIHTRTASPPTHICKHIPTHMYTHTHTHTCSHTQSAAGRMAHILSLIDCVPNSLLENANTHTHAHTRTHAHAHTHRVQRNAWLTSSV